MHRHINNFDDVVVLERTKDRYFSQRRYRHTILPLLRRDSDLLKSDYPGVRRISCTIDNPVSFEPKILGMRPINFRRYGRPTAFAELIEFLKGID